MSIPELSSILPGPVIPAADRNSTSGDARNAAAADFDSFLTLLTAQLRNQDPTAPLDSTQFIEQLASFSTVEQVIGTNDRLDSFIEQSFSGDLATFASWIGRDVVADDGVFIADGEDVTFTVPRNGEATSVQALVRSTDGRLLREIPIEPGATTSEWDGNLLNGASASGNEVVIMLNYFNGAEVLEEVPAQIPRTVSGLRGTAEGLFLELADGGEISPDQITRLTVSNEDR